ncbi:MAG: UDP-N-acetylmuramate--L-alanine ligase [Planctomycetota bacterium]|jgi:UDP-N-acetylmuramate--alanine ligase
MTRSAHDTAWTAPPSDEPVDLAGRRIHFVGVGGCGMSGLARLLGTLGARCTGSDCSASDITRQLAADGIPVDHEQRGDRLPDCDLVVASAAIPDDHAEVAAARRAGVPVLGYAETLGRVQAARTGISIAGTHGKSTTSAMLCHVLMECGLDPGFIIGALCPQIGGGSRVGADACPRGPLAGRPGLLVAEACEFNRSFHHHRPRLALVNNLEEDHLDVYGGLPAIIEAFAAFARRLPPAAEGGYLLIAHDGAHRREVTAGLRCDVETFGFSPAADWQVALGPDGRAATLARDGTTVARWTGRMPGEHNALNAAAAAILAHRVGAGWDAIGTALGGFLGLDRRLQRLGTRSVGGGEIVVYDDYGHHPTEVETTIAAVRRVERPARLICVFQPHQHSRTRFLLDEFARSFDHADIVIVPHIYFVRDSEIERHRVSAADLVDRLRGRDVTAMHVYPFDAIVEQLEIMCRGGDLVLVMGAGPVWQVAHRFLAGGGDPC